MTTLTIARDRLHTDLQPGDRITAIDGRELDIPKTVERARVGTSWRTPDAVALVAPEGSRVEHRLYPDTQVEHEVTIERGEPTPEPVVEPAPEPVRPQADPTARETGVIRPIEPTTEYLRTKARYARRINADEQDAAFVRKVLRNKSYVEALRRLADRPNGYWNLADTFPITTGAVWGEGDNSWRRGWGTTLGFMARYGWCVQIGTAPARWQLTQRGLDVILAYDAEQAADTAPEGQEKPAKALTEPHTARDFTVGQEVTVVADQGIRHGVVTKIGRTRITVRHPRNQRGDMVERAYGLERIALACSLDDTYRMWRIYWATGESTLTTREESARPPLPMIEREEG